MRQQGPSRSFLAGSGVIALLILCGYVFLLSRPYKAQPAPETTYQKRPYGPRATPSKVLQYWHSVSTQTAYTTELVPNLESAAYWEPFQPPNPPAVYTRKDLLIAFASTHDRLPIVLASRAWRQGVKTFIFMDEPLDAKRAPPGLIEGMKAHNEIYDHFPQPKSRPGTWSQPGDARAALVSFRANSTVGIDNYAWILNGDDDTVFLIENVLSMLNRMDHSLPYHLSDNIWFPEWDGRRDTFVHASRRAPRCLPCSLQDPLARTNVGAEINLFRATRACPCTVDALCKGVNNEMILNSWKCDFTKWRPGLWHFSHGGAGVVVSAGLMERTSYWEMEERVVNQGSFTSGDALFTEAVFSKTRVLMTDPGYGYYRQHIRLFDPGWREFREGETLDRGNDPIGFINRLEAALKRDARGCDEFCEDQMRHAMTIHVRKFTSFNDVSNATLAAYGAAHPAFKHIDYQVQPAVYLTERVAEVFGRFAVARGHPYLRRPGE